MRKLAVIVVALAALWLAPGAFASNWCGTGETQVDRPDVTTGQQIHAVVIVPNDGADNFVADANILQNDVDVMSGWWSAQDPSRAPRFDQAAFPGGTCLDISFLRLPDAAAQLQGAGNAFRRVARDLELASFANQFKKYYVYYDGPAVEANICGTGGGEFALGPAFAIVWLQGCPDIESVGIGTHELIHALGALTDMVGAPHACPGDTRASVRQPAGHPLPDRGHEPAVPAGAARRRTRRLLRALGLVARHPGLALAPSPPGAAAAALRLRRRHGQRVERCPGPDLRRAVHDAVGQRLARHAARDGRAGLPPRPLDRDCTGNGQLRRQHDTGGVRDGGLRPERGRAAHLDRRARHRALHAGLREDVPGRQVLTLRAVAAKGWKLARWSGGCKGTKPTCRPATGTAITVRATFARVPKLNPPKR